MSPSARQGIGLAVMLLSCGAVPSRGQSGAASQTWSAIGPSQIATSSYGPVTGRIASIAIDPADATGNTLLLGTAGGGVWASRNANGSSPSFLPLTDDLLFFNDGEATASLAIGAVSFQPGATGVVLAGTGEANPAADAHYGEGLLRSTDGGATWALVQASRDGTGGNHSFTGEGFAGFAWSTSSTADTVAAAVGLPGGSVQVNAVTLDASVRGLYASQDAGQSWQLASIQDVAGDGSLQTVQGPETNYAAYDGNSALAVLWNPLRKMFYAAVQFHGIYASPDGLTWTRLTTQPGPALELAACPTDPGFAGSARCPFAQAALALDAASGDMFAWFVDANGINQGMWRDVCAAQGDVCTNPVTFGAQLATTALENGSGGIDGGIGGLSLAAVSSATASDTTLLAGAASLSACDVARGCQWHTQCAANAFPSARALANTAGSQTVWLGTQGGLWRSNDAGGACASGDFANQNAALGPLAPLESIASDGALVLAGAGVLGSAGTQTAPASSAAGTSANTWPQLQAGEGGGTQLDTVGAAGYVTTAPGVAIARCSGSGCASGSFVAAIGPAQVEDDEALRHAPFMLDPQNASQVLVGTCRVWRGPAAGAGWSAANLLSPMFDGNQQSNCLGNGLVRSVAAGGPANPSGSQVLYAGMQGLALNQFGVETPNAGHLFVTTNAQNATSAVPWTDIALSPVTNDGLNNGIFNAQMFDVAGLAVDAHDPSGGTVYATIYGLHVAHVYRSTDFGAHWLNVSANLPDVPAGAVVVDPNDANTVYVGMDTGVFFTQTIMQCAQQDCWQQYGAGLPNAVVTALAADPGAGVLRAATRGRGAWQLLLATATLANQTTVSVTPASLVFAGQQVSTVSAAQPLSVTVSGVNPFTLTSVAVTGDFSADNGCAGSIATGSSCAVSVTFAPSATGTRKGTLTLFGNLPGGQAGPFALSGTGLSAPSIVLSPSGTLAFGDVTVGQTSMVSLIEIANTGQTSASLNSFAVTGSFAIASNACGPTLAPNTGCAAGVTFTPTTRGVQTGAFSVTDSSGTQTLVLAGTGEAPASLQLTPPSLSFPATNIGAQSPSQAITISNSGDVSAALTGVLASGDFTVSNGCGVSLAGNSSCTLAITFAPTQAGSRTGALTVLTGFQTLTAALNGIGVGTPMLTLTPPSLSFGPENLQQPSAPQTITVTNTGNAADTVTGVTTMTATAGTTDYSVTTNCAVLAPGASCAIALTFAPSVAGPDDGTLTVTASPAAGGPGTSVNAALTGSGNSLAWVAGQAPAATVPAGQTATYALQLQVLGYAGQVTMACSGLPAGAACQLQPATVFSGMGSVMFTVSTGPDVTAALHDTAARCLLAWLPCLFLPGLALPLSRRRRISIALLLLLVSAGCGSSASLAPAPGQKVAPGTYTFTLTASGGGMSTLAPRRPGRPVRRRPAPCPVITLRMGLSPGPFY